MKIKCLEMHNFRNYTKQIINFSESINIFTGSNAQGKTNILEALNYCSIGHSHRTYIDSELICNGKHSLAINVLFFRYAAEQKLSIALNTIESNLKLQKQLAYNQNLIKPKELIGLLNSVIFSPEDITIIKGSPQTRRRFINTEISQANPNYYKNLLQYRKILLQRNNLLKKIQEKKACSQELEGWDLQLVNTGLFIINKRFEAIKKLSMLANLMHRKITNNLENLRVNYIINQYNGEKDLADWYKTTLFKQRKEDILRGNTSIGPHKDDLEFIINNQNLKIFGSQGQQRTGILALKLAELEYMKSETGEYPILLLDDVFSELDQDRRYHLMQFIKDRIQTIITATDAEQIPALKHAKIFHVTNGKVME